MEGFELLFFVFTAVVLLIMFFYFLPLPLWMQARASGVDIGLFQLAFMRIRKTSPKVIVEALITAAKGGVVVSTLELEVLYMAGGNVPNVVQALIVAKKADIELDFEKAAKIDLTGQDVLVEIKKKAAEKPIEF